MTKQLPHVRLIALATCAAFVLAAPLPATATAPEDVAIEMNGFLTGPDSVAGTWRATGAIADAGTYVERARFAGKTIHGVKTLIGANGTIVLVAHAVVAATSPTTIEFQAGHWKVVSGTGAYAALEGGGSPATEPGSADFVTGAVSVVHRGAVKP